jgi:putative tricarboxylic transport membrane protein
MPAAKGMPRADFVTGLAFALLGLAVVWASLEMPRFADRAIDPYTVPGLVPGVLGAIILALGMVLLVRAALAGGWRLGGLRPEKGPGTRRLVLALILCLGYAAGLVGRMPFWLATFLFVAGFVVLLEWPQGKGRRLGRLTLALVYGAAISAAVTLVFQEVFLVRLP